MGHSVNSIVLRAGVSRLWRNSFVIASNLNYYNDLALSFLSISKFVYYLFFIKFLNVFYSSGFLFSHMTVSRSLHNLSLVKIYFYDKFFYNFFNKFYSLAYPRNRSIRRLRGKKKGFKFKKNYKEFYDKLRLRNKKKSQLYISYLMRKNKKRFSGFFKLFSILSKLGFFSIKFFNISKHVFLKKYIKFLMYSSGIRFNRKTFYLFKKITKRTRFFNKNYRNRGRFSNYKNKFSKYKNKVNSYKTKFGKFKNDYKSKFNNYKPYYSNYKRRSKYVSPYSQYRKIKRQRIRSFGKIFIKKLHSMPFLSLKKKFVRSFFFKAFNKSKSKVTISKNLVKIIFSFLGKLKYKKKRISKKKNGFVYRHRKNPSSLHFFYNFIKINSYSIFLKMLFYFDYSSSKFRVNKRFLFFISYLYFFLKFKKLKGSSTFLNSFNYDYSVKHNILSIYYYFLRSFSLKNNSFLFKFFVLANKLLSSFLLNKYNRFALKWMYKEKFLFLLNLFFSRLLTVLVKKKVHVSFFPLSKQSVTPDLLVYYMRWKIRRNFTFNATIKPFMKGLIGKGRRSNSFITGFYAKGFGRFSRKQRASMIKRSKGKIGLSEYSSLLNYAYLPVITKFGIGSVRLWINYSRNKFALRHKRNFLNIFN